MPEQLQIQVTLPPWPRLPNLTGGWLKVTRNGILVLYDGPVAYAQTAVGPWLVDADDRIAAEFDYVSDSGQKSMAPAICYVALADTPPVPEAVYIEVVGGQNEPKP